MRLVIFSCSPRPERNSNTAAIVDAFKNGYEKGIGEKAYIYYLYKRENWEWYKEIFEQSNEIIFAIPLFVECVPGMVMEFFEFLSPKHDIKATRIGFILQGGFEEAHQLRTAEHYLERLPCYLNCQYIGTLIKGGMFVLSLSSEKAKKTMLQPFFEVGRDFANTRVFDKEKVSAFAAPENYSKSLILLSNILRPLNKLAWRLLAKRLHTGGRLDVTPYETYDNEF